MCVDASGIMLDDRKSALAGQTDVCTFVELFVFTYQIIESNTYALYINIDHILTT